MTDASSPQHSREQALAEMLRLIEEHPGIRPSELNSRMGRAHSAHLRNALIKRGLVKKLRMGAAVRYYAAST